MIKNFNQFLNEDNSSNEEDIFDISQTLTTMIEGDDMDFDPLEPDDEIWTKIGFPTFAMDPPDDIDEFLQGISNKKFAKLKQVLTEEGYLNE